jgi:hypothetical protein
VHIEHFLLFLQIALGTSKYRYLTDTEAVVGEDDVGHYSAGMYNAEILYRSDIVTTYKAARSSSGVSCFRSSVDPACGI